MKRLLMVAAAALLSVGAVMPGHGQSNPVWIDKEFSDPANVPVLSIESFLNESCQPSGFDGIRLLGVQNGHNSTYNLHVYCRQDKSTAARYQVTMTPIFNRQVDPTVAPLAHQPNKLIGPFYFGKTGENDAFLLVEKIK